MRTKIILNKADSENEPPEKDNSEEVLEEAVLIALKEKGLIDYNQYVQMKDILAKDRKSNK